MKGEELIAAQAKMKLSNLRLARILGAHETTIAKWRKDVYPVPRHVEAVILLLQRLNLAQRTNFLDDFTPQG